MVVPPDECTTHKKATAGVRSAETTLRGHAIGVADYRQTRESPAKGHNYWRPRLRMRRSHCGSHTQRFLTLVAFCKDSKVCKATQLGQMGLQSAFS